MTKNLVMLDFSLQRFLQSENLNASDAEEIGVFLTGKSVLDWKRLTCGTVPAVNELLRVNGFNTNNISDEQRLAQIHSHAVEYLTEEYDLKLPRLLVNPTRIQNIFLVASGKSKLQKSACMILKVMHVITHLEARQLLFHLTVSERQLFEEVELKVQETVEQMRSMGFRIVDFKASRKTRNSIITKTMTKMNDTAAQVYDRLRFRIISKDVSDIVPIIYYLKKRLIPFNHIIPGESKNNIVSERVISPALTEEALVRARLTVPKDQGDPCPVNEFTHPQYRVTSFVADIPLRIHKLMEDLHDPALEQFGKLVFIPAEFQIYDMKSYSANEEGPANHDLYKERQKVEVWQRLTNSLDVPEKFLDSLENDPIT